MGRKSMLREVDALDLLAHDHHTIERLFHDYERLARRQGEHERKGELVGQLCFRLSIHMQIEEDIFYPAARAAMGPDSTLAQPRAAQPSGPGASDICFVWPGRADELQEHLWRHGVEVELGPLEREGARGTGTSVYFRDPDGNLLELIVYPA